MRYAQYILGSRSPRRRELLELLVPANNILVKPPRSSAEASFTGLKTEAEIAARLHDIVHAKKKDVDEQLTDDDRRQSVRIVADTIIVAKEPDGTSIVLGQPPEPNWQTEVETWFSRYYSSRTHTVWTGICVWTTTGTLLDQTVTTSVTFRTLTAGDIAWYISTTESLGKAGGYAVQGLASLFISEIRGSLSNVIGLPLEVLRPMLLDDHQPD